LIYNAEDRLEVGKVTIDGALERQTVAVEAMTKGSIGKLLVLRRGGTWIAATGCILKRNKSTELAVPGQKRD